MSYKLAFYKSDVVGAESNPNSVAPDPTRIIATPTDVKGGYSALLWVGDGTSLVVTVWFNDPTSTLWVPLNSPLTLSANNPATVVVPSGASIFTQLGTNTGSVTKFGVGFLSVDAAAAQSQAASAPLPGGSATSAKQDTGNTSLASIDAKTLTNRILTGPIALVSDVVGPMSVQGLATVNVTVTGTWSGTLKLVASYDAITFFDGNQFLTANVVNITGNGTYTYWVTAVDQVKIVATAWTSGSASVRIEGTSVPLTEYATITDGINAVKVKGGSTAAAAGDNSFVVALSPNSPVPAGTNVIGKVGRSSPAVTVKNAATINASGSTVVVMEPCASASLVVNVKAAPTGTAPTLTWTIAEVDPIDQTTVTGSTITGSAITASGTQTLLLGTISSGTVLVSWTIGGSAGPSFTLVNASLIPSPTMVGQYNATPPTLATGTAAVFQSDSRGNEKVAEAYVDQYVDQNNGLAAVQFRTLPVNTYTATSFTNRGANATLNVKTTAGVIVGVSCMNTTSQSRYLQVHNTATTPSAAAVPVLSFLVPANSQVVIGSDFFTLAGFYCATGIAFACSTTIDTYTAGLATDHSTQIFYY